MSWLLQEKTKAGFFTSLSLGIDQNCSGTSKSSQCKLRLLHTHMCTHIHKLFGQVTNIINKYMKEADGRTQVEVQTMQTDGCGVQMMDCQIWRQDTKVHACKYYLQPLRCVDKMTFKPNVTHSLGAKATYVQTHIISHTAKNKKKSLEISAHFGTSRIWQKKRLEDVIQTIIKTKYASFLAQCRRDQWEIGRNMRNVCFGYRQPTLMFLIGLKWMGSSRVLK